MTPDDHFAQICEIFYRLLQLDPQFAEYLDARRNAERRRLGLPITEYKRKGQEE